MELSAKMPATMDATQEATMPAKRESDAPAFKGEGGSMKPSLNPIMTESNPHDGQWDAVDRERGIGWETADRLHGPTSWELNRDRINNGEGGLPQRKQ